MEKIDYFKGFTTREELYGSMDKIQVREEIHDCMPKYSNMLNSIFSIARELPTAPPTEKDMDLELLGMSKEHILREKFVAIGMFAFPSWRWINPFVEWINGRKCLEVMAGRGWLSYALRQKGVDVIATDDFSWHRQAQFSKWNDTVTEVKEYDAVAAIEQFGKDVGIVIMGWPYMDDTAYRVLKRLHEINPNAILVYIGEGGGGCTADDSFFDHFMPIHDLSFYETVATKYERWDGIRDRIVLGHYSEDVLE